MAWSAKLLTVLPLLLCPLLMLACVWAMRNRETPQRLRLRLRVINAAAETAFRDRPRRQGRHQIEVEAARMRLPAGA